ncbi:hypothetical protein NDU88_007105 [Pleurodeles waltl]|uniref:Uncharacterized protein n=1 Tax=Pleurodeles waltl TaxID=8319 RepID=A0AAV7PKV1_PLEWA|nr:hypothetical protein NDU88_007105 [Pleurodeles waltl]
MPTFRPRSCADPGLRAVREQERFKPPGGAHAGPDCRSSAWRRRVIALLPEVVIPAALLELYRLTKLNDGCWGDAVAADSGTPARGSSDW